MPNPLSPAQRDVLALAADGEIWRRRNFLPTTPPEWRVTADYRCVTRSAEVLLARGLIAVSGEPRPGYTAQFPAVLTRSGRALLDTLIPNPKD